MSTTTFEAKVPAVQVMQVRKAWKAGDDHFEVLSRDGKRRYQVRVEGGMPLCSCTAARYGQPCYHAAVVLRRLMNEGAASTRESGPVAQPFVTHLHPDCTCAHEPGCPCDTSCPVHAPDATAKAAEPTTDELFGMLG